MKKFGRNTLAVGLATLLVTAAVSFSANGADTVVAQSSASTVKSTGLLGILDSESCDATTSTDADAEATGRCGDGLSFSNINAYSQNASAKGDATSTASASIAPIDVTALDNIDLSTLPDSLNNIDTGTILDDVVNGLGLGAILDGLGVLDALQNAIQGPLDAISGAIPVKLEIGAINAQCSADPDGATGDSSVAGIDVVLEIAGQEVRIPMNVGTAPNSPLVGYNEDAESSAVQDIVDSVLDGLQDTLDTSLGGVLGPLGAVVGTLQTALLDPVLQAVGTAILEPVGDLLENQLGLIGGTVNKQSVVDGKAEVTALDLSVGPGGSLTAAQLATVTCGKNAAFVAADDTDAVADDTDVTDVAADDSDTVADADADADADAAADADSAADADVTTSLPNTGAPNLLPFWLLGMALVAFGGAVLVNERRRTL